MRIAVLASNLLPLPPDSTNLPPGFAGAAEMVMWHIAEGLVLRGHEVTLFASGDSQTHAKLVSVTKIASALDEQIGMENHVEFEYLLISRCYQMAQEEEFDIIHSSFDTKSAYYAGLVKTPTVATLHSPLEGVRNKILDKIFDTQWYVSISNAQRLGLPSLHYVATVYHGLDLSEFTFGNGLGDFMMIAGRISPKKGFLEAATISRDTKRSLWILGSHEPRRQEYWESINKLIDNRFICWEGMVSRQNLMVKYQQAKLFLFPLQWEEPFGLVMIEAMACGTPVVAYGRGSVPEVVSDGETGYIVTYSNADRRGNWIIKKTGEEGMKEAIEKIYSMSSDEYQIMRRACRARVEKLFTVEKMVGNYERVYEKVLTQYR